MAAVTVKRLEGGLPWILWFFLGMAVLQPSDDLFRFVYFAGILPLTLYLYWHNRGHAQPLLRSLIPGVALLLFLFMSVTWSSHVSESAGRYFRWFLETVIFFAAVAWCGYQVRRENLAFGRYLHMIVLAASIASLGLYIYQGNYPRRLEGIGLLGHPILGSSVLISLWALGTLDTKMHANRWLWLLMGAGIAVMAFVYLSQSRGPLLALFGFILCLIVLLLLKRRATRYWGIALLALLAAGAAAATETQLLASMIDRGDSYRLEIWSAIIGQWRGFWLTGVGIATPFPASEAGQAARGVTGITIAHPHNILISMWLFVGIPGVLLFSGFVLHVLKKIWCGLASPWRGLGVAILLVTMALCFTDTYRLISSPRPIWIIFWLPLGFLLGWSVALPGRPALGRDSGAAAREQG